jgi:hypothetical protein
MGKAESPWKSDMSSLKARDLQVSKSAIVQVRATEKIVAPAIASTVVLPAA